MFIGRSFRGYTRDWQQKVSGKFLLLFSGFDGGDIWPTPLYGVVRKVVLTQCGHWMMGKATIAGIQVGVSGTYGSDGLPVGLDRAYIKERGGKWEHKELPGKARDKLVRLPDDLAKIFWAGGGHNEAGSEGPAIHDWVEKNLL